MLLCRQVFTVMSDGRSGRVSSCTFVCPLLNISHHFLTFLSFIHFFQLPVNFCRFQISGIQKSKHTPHLTVGGIINHAVHFEVTQNAQWWLVATSTHNIMRKHVKETRWLWKEEEESAARWECTNACYFLDHLGSSWEKVLHISITVYKRIFQAYFFRNLAKKNWGARIIWNNFGMLCLQTNDAVTHWGVKFESRVKQTIATRSRYRLFTAKEKA